MHVENNGKVYLLFTMLILNSEVNHSRKHQLLGYAYLSTVCRNTPYALSINEFDYVNVAETAVHELGHA